MIREKQNTCWRIVLARLASFEFRLDLMNLVPYRCGSLVGFVRHCRLQFLAELDEPELLLARLAGLVGSLAAMLRVIVNVLEQLVQLGLKDFVIMRTSEPAICSKLAEGDATVRADQFIDGVK